MTSSSSPGHPDGFPPGGRPLFRLLRSTDRLFDRLYSSAWNPLYQSGSIATLLLAIVCLTGFYLLFFYEVANPWQSVHGIQNDVFAGKWVRAVHRYASDLAMVIIILHGLRMFAEGKTWGPRTLAWTSGIAMVLVLCISSWTGFVLIYDQFGLELAREGARLMEIFPLFSDPPVRNFSGEQPLESSFYFMNLFLHVALPLGMILMVGLHTLKLSRSVWFPTRGKTITICVSLALLPVLVPLDLPAAGDPLSITGLYKGDWFYGFWLPMTAPWSPALVWIILVILTVLLSGIPWWWRPRMAHRPAPSRNVPEVCQGCAQCFMDCPYDAIAMVPRKADWGPGSEVVAEVDPGRCISCGICSASCDQMRIGPPDLTGQIQLKQVREWGKDLSSSDVVVVACKSAMDGDANLIRRFPTVSGMRPFLHTAECSGSMHSFTLDYLAGKTAGVVIATCPPHNCLHREGPTILADRLAGTAKPTVRDTHRPRIHLLENCGGDRRPMIREYEGFVRKLAGEASVQPAPTSLIKRSLFPAFITMVLLGLMALSNDLPFPAGTGAGEGGLRISWRAPGRTAEVCRPFNETELGNLPAHMQGQRGLCRTTHIPHRLRLMLNGKMVLDRQVEPTGARGDRPLFVYHEIPLAAGSHELEVRFEATDLPENARESGNLQPWVLQETVTIQPGRMLLVTARPRGGLTVLDQAR